MSKKQILLFSWFKNFFYPKNIKLSGNSVCKYLEMKLLLFFIFYHLNASWSFFFKCQISRFEIVFLSLLNDKKKLKPDFNFKTYFDENTLQIYIHYTVYLLFPCEELHYLLFSKFSLNLYSTLACSVVFHFNINKTICQFFICMLHNDFEKMAESNEFLLTIKLSI